MSMYRNIYLGVYIRAKRRIRTTSRDFHGYPNEHKVKETDNYCPVCGEKIVLMKEVLEDKDTFTDILESNYSALNEYEELFELVDDKDYDYLVPNSSNEGLRLENIYDVETEIFPFDMKESISIFKKKYAGFIKAFSQYYQSIEVKYGVMVWYS